MRSDWPSRRFDIHRPWTQHCWRRWPIAKLEPVVDVFSNENIPRHNTSPKRKSTTKRWEWAKRQRSPVFDFVHDLKLSILRMTMQREQRIRWRMTGRYNRNNWYVVCGEVALMKLLLPSVWLDVQRSNKRNAMRRGRKGIVDKFSISTSRSKRKEKIVKKKFFWVLHSDSIVFHLEVQLGLLFSFFWRRRKEKRRKDERRVHLKYSSIDVCYSRWRQSIRSVDKTQTNMRWYYSAWLIWKLFASMNFSSRLHCESAVEKKTHQLV